MLAAPSALQLASINSFEEMETKYSVGEAAKAVGTTAETLRHYDRIGLVKPSFRDEENGYRFYSADDLVRLSTVMALRSLGLSTEQTREQLHAKDWPEVIALLQEAERQNGEQMQELLARRSRIQRALSQYETLQAAVPEEEPEVGIRNLDPRVLLLAHHRLVNEKQR